MKKIILLFFFTSFQFALLAQSEAYQQKKAKQLSERSIFQDEIDGKFPDHIIFQDDDVIAFRSNSPQLPVHILVIPKKRIPTFNDLEEKDGAILVKMLFTAKKIAKEMGIAESGYRLVINTNEDAGQSVFHLHLHILGGHKTGPMVEQKWREEKKALKAEEKKN